MDSETQKSIECKKILNFLGNNKTKVVENEDIKSNYYLLVNDTIYLSNNQKHMNKSKLKIDKKVNKYMVMCHECIHSIQSKTIHLTNIISANIEIILFCILVGSWILRFSSITLKFIYFMVLLISTIIRLILEYEAINKSFLLLKDLIKANIVLEVKESQANDVISKVRKLVPLEIVRITLPKILRGIIILFI